MRGCGATSAHAKAVHTQVACAAMSPEAVAKRAWLARQVEDLQGQVKQLQGR
jgi:hypothetical protein